ncbi:MAG: hypothetical protein P0107_00750 [Nitrosomonas sp.]|nr:hypothetical protein [Nitrosomonas sp.]
MKPTLQLKLNTGLTLTPQLQQSIRLLQLSTLELNQEITRLVQENPLLELDEGIDRDEFETEGQDISLSPPNHYHLRICLLQQKAMKSRKSGKIRISRMTGRMTRCTPIRNFFSIHVGGAMVVMKIMTRISPA